MVQVLRQLQWKDNRYRGVMLVPCSHYNVLSLGSVDRWFGSDAHWQLYYGSERPEGQKDTRDGPGLALEWSVPGDPA